MFVAYAIFVMGILCFALGGDRKPLRPKTSISLLNPQLMPENRISSIPRKRKKERKNRMKATLLPTKKLSSFGGFRKKPTL